MKTGRVERNRTFQNTLQERKRLRRDRRRAHHVFTVKERAELALTAEEAIYQSWPSIEDATSLPIDHPETRKHVAELLGKHHAPTNEQWTDMLAHAKRRKRSVRKMAEKAGWIRVGDGDGTEQFDWTVA